MYPSWRLSRARMSTAANVLDELADQRIANGNISCDEVQLPAAKVASEIELRKLSAIVVEKREPQWLQRKVLERKVLAVLAGPRGSFKSFVALDWAMRSAVAGYSVVILSGEGGGLDRRVDAWMKSHAPLVDLDSLAACALERPLNLNADEVLLELRAAIEKQPRKPDLIVIDTLSKFSPGLDENSNTEVALLLARLSSQLRDIYGSTVLLVVHAGHGDSKRPRGASALMANPDAEYIIERPDAVGMLCTVSRERFKDSPSLPALTYEARVVDLSRVDSYGEPVTSLVLDATDAIPIKPRGKWGCNQVAVMSALKEWSRVNANADHISSIDMRALLKAQGIGAKRKPEILDSLVNARIITASIGGHTFDPKAL